MTRRCERPGCGGMATVAYGFDTERRLVVLAAVVEDEADRVRSGVLCRRHADSLTAPRGWWVDDRRQERPTLFGDSVGRGVGPESTTAGAAANIAQKRPRKSRPVELLASDRSLFDIDDAIEDALQFAGSPAASSATHLVEPPAPVIEVADPDETKALAWTPVFDQTSDLDGLLNARSPLLSRAFGRQRVQRTHRS